MNLREVRQAAERVTELKYRTVYQDATVMGHYILATIDPEPEAGITAEWLREEWGFKEYTVYDSVTRLRIDIGEIAVWMHPHTDGWDFYGVDFEWPHVLTTRQQFCDLAKALGIPRKQPKPEPEGCTCLSSPNMLYAPCSYCDKQRKDGAK